MKTSKTIAGLIGPTLVAIAASMLLNIGSFPELAEQVSRDPAPIFVSGILLFVAGLAIVRVHNRWTNGWPVLVTVLGWLAVFSGLARMLFPTGLAAIASGFGQNIGATIAGAIVGVRSLGSTPEEQQHDPTHPRGIFHQVDRLESLRDHGQRDAAPRS